MNRLSRTPLVYIIDDLGVGGAQRQLVELVKSLPTGCYIPHVISLSTTRIDYVEALRAARIPVTLIPQQGKWSWSAFITLWKTLRAIRPTIVNTWLFTADLYGRLAAWCAGVPIIISTVHSVDLDKPSRHVIVDRWLKGVTHRFIATANAVGSVLNQREGVPQERMTIIHNGIDLREFVPASYNGHLRRTLKIGPNRPLIGIVGRLARVKDHETFIRAASIVIRTIPNCAFLIVGSGALRSSIQQLVAQLGLKSHIYFLDHQPLVAPVYDTLDLLVVSSLYEGCCRVILEAMAMEKPVVATAVGGNPELVIPGQTGLLVPVQDPPQLAEAIIQLLSDPARAKQMGTQGRRAIEGHFGLGRMVEETDALYHELALR